MEVSDGTLSIFFYSLWFASSKQQLFTSLLGNDGAGEGGKMSNFAHLSFIFLFLKLFFSKLQYIMAFASICRDCMGYSSLIAVRQSCETHTNAHF